MNINMIFERIIKMRKIIGCLVIIATALIAYGIYGIVTV